MILTRSITSKLPSSIAILRITSSNNNRLASLSRRFYFTNGDRVKREDPYSVLGLQWGDGATTTEIKAAYKQKAAQLHPDVNRNDPTAPAKFQQLQKAYTTLLKLSENINAAENTEEWRFAIWNQGDRIAVDRTDVAGTRKMRPAVPATTAAAFSRGQLGHPDGRGLIQRNGRAEYLGDGKAPRSSSVGRGLNKWVEPKEFKPWNGETTCRSAATSSKRASDTATTETKTEGS